MRNISLRNISSDLFWTVGMLLAVCFDFVQADWPLYRGDEQATAAVMTTETATVRLPDRLKIVWEKQLENDWIEATAIIVDDRIFVGSSDEGMRAFSLQDGKEHWKYPLEYGVLVPASYFKDADANETIFFGDSEGTLHAVDACSGKRRWIFKTKGTIHNAPNVDKKTNRVLLASEDGSLYALESLTGKLVWEYKAEDQIRCFPTIVDRVCFVAGCDSRFHVVDLEKGTVLAKVDIASPTGATPAVLGNRIFFGTEGNEFLAVDWKPESSTAEIGWRCELKQAVRAPAACRDDMVVFCGMDRTVRAFHARSGKPCWEFRTKGRMESSGPLIVEDRVYVASQDSVLFVLDLKTGKKIDSITLSGKLLASPAVSSGRIVIGSDDGILFCLGLFCLREND